MRPTVYGMNHIALEVDDIETAVRFYTDVFGLEQQSEGEGEAFFKVGEYQFLALFQNKDRSPDAIRHFGIIVKDDDEIAAVREKVKAWGLELIPPFACDFRDPFGNRIQVVDLSVVPDWWRGPQEPAG
jgi:catechol 2,3-dioxygenase-like lactoylglutathione lyase family enzyme